MPKAADIMTTSVVSVKPDQTLKEAVQLLAENKISGLPVVDSGNKVIGVISENDIVDYSSNLHVVSLISSSSWISPHTDVSQMTSVKKGFEKLSETRVETVMSKKVVCVKKSTTGEEIARLMKKSKVNRLPVEDENGKLVGIITRGNLVNYLADK